MNEPIATLFRYIPLADYQAPAWPATENVRRGLRAFWRSVHRRPAGEAPAVDPRTLTHLPAGQLEGVACPQPTEALIEALSRALDPWFTSAGADRPVRVVVSATHCGTGAALHGWARAQGWLAIEPPTPEQILAGGEDWLAGLAKLGDADCLLPRLERCFLRHADGLDLLRRLLAWLLARRGRCLVGCNSWAWAFLCAALGADALMPRVLTLAPFDGEALGQWFRRLLESCPKPGPRFRNARSGRPVLPPGADGDPRSAKPEPMDDFLTHLAAGSRGIAAVAWAIWRHSLRVAGTAETADAREQAAGDVASTIWVKPWAELNLPAPLPHTRQSHRFIFHALLIQGGLSEAALEAVLPRSGAMLQPSLSALASAGLLAEEAGVWQVTPCAYPGVRQTLVNEEYLAGRL